MEKYLLAKGFNQVEQNGLTGLTGYTKRYKGFVLTIATMKGVNTFYGCISIKTLEIGLPDAITVDWVEEFEEQNEDLVL